MLAHKYLLPIHGGARLFYLRIPAEGLRWREDVLRGLTSVMRHYGMKRRDVFSIDGFCPREHASFLVKLGDAYAGDRTILPDFDLWSWSGTTFELLREVK